MKIGFIGLGTMGYLMAGRLQNAGHELKVFNRRTAVTEQWVKDYGGIPTFSPAQAAQQQDVVISCVSDDQAIRDVTLGNDGAFHELSKGTVYVDHTTASANIAQELNRLALARGAFYLDAPVSGGKPGATKGTLTIMVGGHEEALTITTPVLMGYAKAIHYVGASGAGQIAKSANQICIAGIMQSMAEAFALIDHANLDAHKILQVLLGGSGRSWQMENRGNDMLIEKYDFGFASDMLAKDLNIALDSAKQFQLALPATQLAYHSYQQLITNGFAQEDISAIMRLFKTK